MEGGGGWSRGRTKKREEKIEVVVQGVAQSTGQVKSRLLRLVDWLLATLLGDSPPALPEIPSFSRARFRSRRYE